MTILAINPRPETHVDSPPRQRVHRPVRINRRAPPPDTRRRPPNRRPPTYGPAFDDHSPFPNNPQRSAAHDRHRHRIRFTSPPSTLHLVGPHPPQWTHLGSATDRRRIRSEPSTPADRPKRTQKTPSRRP